MEIVSIEAETFERMNQMLDSLVKAFHRQTGNHKNESLKDWLDNQDVCILMNISPRKLMTMRRTGAIPYSRIDKKIYYKRKDIMAYMENILEKGSITKGKE